MELLDELRDTTASIYFVPDIFVFDLIQARSERDQRHAGGRRCARRRSTATAASSSALSDMRARSRFLLLAAPLLLAIAILV